MIQTTHAAEMEATMGSGAMGVIKETFLVPSNLYRVYLTFMAQIRNGLVLVVSLSTPLTCSSC